MEGNLPLALIPLMAPVPLGRFLVLSFFTWSQVKGTLKQVMGLKDVSGRSAGWMACCWGRVSGSLPGLYLQHGCLPLPLLNELCKWSAPLFLQKVLSTHRC